MPPRLCTSIYGLYNLTAIFVSIIAILNSTFVTNIMLNFKNIRDYFLPKAVNSFWISGCCLEI